MSKRCDCAAAGVPLFSCPRCGARGVAAGLVDMARADMTRKGGADCAECEGKGYVDDGEPCRECDGTGREPDDIEPKSTGGKANG